MVVVGPKYLADIFTYGLAGLIPLSEYSGVLPQIIDRTPYQKDPNEPVTFANPVKQFDIPAVSPAATWPVTEHVDLDFTPIPDVRTVVLKVLTPNVCVNVYLHSGDTKTVVNQLFFLTFPEGTACNPTLFRVENERPIPVKVEAWILGEST